VFISATDNNKEPHADERDNNEEHLILNRTSVSLEDPFWYQFKEISAEKGIALNVLAAEIDDARGIGIGLASAIRLYILDHIISKK